MSDNPRIEDLRRRLRLDPASIAFAQLAEECRRAGRHEESIEVCRDGLTRHPGYLSARVTLGRALLDSGRLDEAQREFEIVRRAAPDNLAALRSLAEVHQTRGDIEQALVLFSAALTLAQNDPDLQQTVVDLRRQADAANRPSDLSITSGPSSVVPLSVPALSVEPAAGRVDHSEPDRAARTIVVLERWLEAIHVARTQPRA